MEKRQKRRFNCEKCGRECGSLWLNKALRMWTCFECNNTFVPDEKIQQRKKKIVLS